MSTNYHLHDKFHFRTIHPDEADEAARLEAACFPPNEACSPVRMQERAETAPGLFLAAWEDETGKMAGFLNGLSTDEPFFRDEFFTDASLYAPEGKNVMLLGLAVLPEYRRMGLAGELVRLYGQRERKKGRKRLILTCLEEKVTMYEGFGFTDLGESASVWGGEKWHEMAMDLTATC